jgi:hypothetical protein
MSEPDFTQIPAEIANCPDPGWKHTGDGTGEITFTHAMWPDSNPQTVWVRTDHGGPFREVTLEVGDVASDTDVCKAHHVSFTVEAHRRTMIRLKDPATGEVLSTEHFRHLGH